MYNHLSHCLMGHIKLWSISLVFMLCLSSQAFAQPDVSTINFRIQHIKGCIELIYPSASGYVISGQDRHELETVKAGDSIVEVINEVTRSIYESRDGIIHSDEELAAAGYEKITIAGKEYRVKDFTVTRRAKFNLCIKPGFNGDAMTLEARYFDYDLQQNTEPDNLLKFANAETTAEVRSANEKFIEESKAAINRLIEEINQRVVALEDIEILQMLRRRGIEKQVKFSFGGNSYSVTVKLRRVLD